jgi:hypothetical protein
MDATSAWSDCNRADGHLFRVDDITSTNNPERVRIAIYVPADQMSALEDVGYEDSGANRTHFGAVPQVGQPGNAE